MSSDVDRHPILTGVTVTPDEARKAQRAAGRNASSRDELETFLHMLGLRPGQENPLMVKEIGAPF